MAYQALSPNGQRHDRIPENIRPEDTLVDADVKPEDDAPVSITQKMLSAVSGSVLTSLLVTPLDVVRVRLQSQAHSPSPSSSRPTPTTSSFANLPPNLGISSCCREVFWVNNHAPYCVASPVVSSLSHAPMPNTTSGLSASAAASCAAEESQRKAFTSTWDGMRKISQQEGITTLWRGLSPTLVMAVPGNVIYFAGYDWLRTSSRSPFRTWMPMNDNYAPLAAGSLARIVAAIAVSPIEMFRTRMQAAHQAPSAAGHFRDTLYGLGDMVQSQGVRSLWRGLTLTLWRDVPFSAIYWWGYEAGRNTLCDARARARGRDPVAERAKSTDLTRARSRSRSQENHTATLVDSFIAGAGSGAVAAFVTTPFDVGKTRQQVIRHSSEAASSGPKTNVKADLLPEERSMPRFLLHIFQEQGVSGLLRGWAARCLKVAPACAIMISSYEIGKKMAADINERKERRSEV